MKTKRRGWPAKNRPNFERAAVPNPDDSSHPNAIEPLAITSLTPRECNPRTHSAKQIRQIADSIRQFGFVNPVLIDADGGVIAGHGRIEAAKLLGMEQVPTIRLDRMNGSEKRAYVLADNKLAENAGWDRQLLALELQYLTELELDFDATVTGFETGEIDLLIGDLQVSHVANQADEVPAVDATGAVSRPNDLWLLGKHRLLCADATRPESFTRLLDGAQAQMVFTDPPCNAAIPGNVRGSGLNHHPEAAMANGEISRVEFSSFLKRSLHLLAVHSADGSIHFICMNWRRMSELLVASREVYSDFEDLCIWNKDRASQGSLYRSKHELVFVFKHGTGKHISNVRLGRTARHRENVWDFPAVSALPGGIDDPAMRPTIKPVGLVAHAIRDCSRRNGIVLDCFGGSGTTVIAAQETGRLGYVMEIDPVYVDVIVRRFEKHTGETATDALTGRSFAAIKREREDMRDLENADATDKENA